MIPVTKTFLPSIDHYISYVQIAFEEGWITNRGKLVVELERRLRDFLEVENILITNNGTVPLQIALKILGNEGEIITTPFSYVATSSSIIWENCIPVFVDIDPVYWTIDETKIESAITKKTTCILATHVFGNPCNIEVIESVAKKHNLKVIYDAAHCFGVKYNSKSIFNYGDVSTCSFHATKIFHTGEGGAVFCKDNQLFHTFYYSHNFGHNGPLEFYGLGINGKISELQAAMGLSVLPYFDEIMLSRKRIVSMYDNIICSPKIQRIKIRENTSWNYSYYPIVFNNELELNKVLYEFNKNNIFPRRYFYPSLNKLPYLKSLSVMPISEQVAGSIICLPLYHSLTDRDIDLIVTCLQNSLS